MSAVVSPFWRGILGSTVTTLTVSWYDLSMRATVRVLIVGGLVVILSGSLGWAATAGTAKPALSIVQPNPLVLTHCHAPGTERACWSGTTRLMIKNDGPDACKYYIRTFKDSEGNHTEGTPGRNQNIAGYRATEVSLSLIVYDNWSTSVPVALVVRKPGGTSPVITTLSISRIPQTRDYVVPVLLGVLYSLLVTLVAASRARPVDETSLWGGLGTPVEAPQSWSFGGGWVTGLSALGATASTILAATGFLADVLPGIDIQRFFSPTVLFGGAILAAPLAYTACSKRDTAKGTRGGLYLACLLTLFGVSGQLTILGVLVQLAHADLGFKLALYTALALTGLLIALYTCTTIKQLVSLTEENVSSLQAAIRHAGTFLAGAKRQLFIGIMRR
jgi:hypothetical protein